MKLLEMNKFTFSYPGREKPVLNEVDFMIEPGEFVLVCGSSGCGKTTFLRCMKPASAPQGTRSGELHCPFAGQTGYVFQNPENQIVTDTVRHELAFGLENLGFPTHVIRQRVAETALFFGIDEWIDRSVHQISGGEKQLLNLASVMAMRPKLLLLDEPTSQLDPAARKNFLELLIRVNRELGIAVIVCEHHLEEVLPYAGRVIQMEAGRLKESKKPVTFVNDMIEEGSPYCRVLPAAARIAKMLKNDETQIPLSVRAGRRYLEEYIRAENPQFQEIICEDRKEERSLLLRTENLWFQYGRREPYVIRNLSLDIREGQMHMLLGGNGSGKSTLLYLLSGREFPQRGKIRLKSKGRTIRTGLLVQNPKAMFSRDSVKEELDSCGLSAEMVRWLKLSDLYEQHPYDLSGGEQQRLALGMVLAKKPEILLLDEPAKGLDPLSKAELGDYLREYVNQGHTVLCVTHDVDFAAAYGDVCSLLFCGEVLSTEETRTFFEGNTFYTTDAARIMKGFIKKGLLCEDLNCV